MSKSPVIEMKELSIGYASKKKTKLIAKDISATIYSGELTCLLGANGVGKSTLLKTLSAFLPKLSGEIRIGKVPIDSLHEKKISKQISVVLTDKFDIRDMSVTELVGLGRTPHTGFWGNLSEKDNEIIRYAISLVKIESLADRMLYTLSDGERQKTMIAKALAQETPIIFLDEPTAFLDFQSKVEVMQLLHRLSREANKTIFLSTHDIELALQMADKIWLMDKTSGIRIGIPDELSQDGTIARFFERKRIVYDAQNKFFRIEK